MSRQGDQWDCLVSGSEEALQHRARRLNGAVVIKSHLLVCSTNRTLKYKTMHIPDNTIQCSTIQYLRRILLGRHHVVTDRVMFVERT